MKNRLLFTLLTFLCYTLAFSQGSTTGSMSGKVQDESGVSLMGATVIATHVPTGAEYATIVSESGQFRLFNLETGGPYRINVSYVGFKEHVESDVILRLGQDYRLTVTMREDSQELEEVVVSAQGKASGASGSGTNVGQERVEESPTISRDLTDYTRLDPRASIANSENGNATTFAGVSSRYNAIFIDGAVNNDLFGLTESGTNGGQAGISPISIDAVKEIQISVAPYDVTKGGFVGGSINAVTRTGTNEFEGSVYHLLRNESFAGKTPTDDAKATREKLPEFTARTYGFRLGGPIIKNKLFFFINTEIQRNETPYVFPVDNYRGDAPISKVDQVRAKLLKDYGYETGDFRENISKLNGEKVIAKFNWNINQQHRMSFRHSYVKGVQVGKLEQDAGSLKFANSAEYFPSTTNSSALELNSRFGDNKSNKLIIGYTDVNDDRDITGNPFPSIRIDDGGARITAGSEPFSLANIVQQKTLSITDNLTIYLDKHTLTLGTHNEFYKIKNVFLPYHPSQYRYSSVDKFLANEAYLQLYGHTVGNKEIGDDAISAAANFKASQLAFYAQDEFQINDNLKILGGIRVDIPVFSENAPKINDDFNTNTIPLLEKAGYDLQGAKASILPKSQLMWSPRFGFEYDFKKDGTTKLKGGVGIFTSRVPFVWPGGVYLRNGLAAGFTVNFNGAGFGPVGAGGIAIEPDVTKQPFKDNVPSGDVDIFAENFKYPQLLKSNISFEKRFDSGLFALIDFQYSQTMNNLTVQNVNTERKPTGYLTGTPDNRPVFSGNSIDSKYGYISLMTNNSKGNTYSTSIQLQKNVGQHLNASLSYNYTKATSVLDGTEFINSDNWKRFHSVNGRNFPGEAQISRFSTGSRIIGLLSFKKEYNSMKTLVSLFYNGQSGGRFSYVYNDEGGLNGDPGDDENRNLIYVPAKSSDIILVDKNGVTAAEQWKRLNSFIENDPYLSERRGQYAERNGARTPFENVIDLKVEQSVFLNRKNGKKHEIKLSFDIFNFTNFLNKNWGRRYLVGDRLNYALIDFEGMQKKADGTDSTTPTFSFTGSSDEKPWDISDAGINTARWQAQFGIRYSF